MRGVSTFTNVVSTASYNMTVAIRESIAELSSSRQNWSSTTVRIKRMSSWKSIRERMFPVIGFSFTCLRKASEGRPEELLNRLAASKPTLV